MLKQNECQIFLKVNLIKRSSCQNFLVVGIFKLRESDFAVQKSIQKQQFASVTHNFSSPKINSELFQTRSFEILTMFAVLSVSDSLY